jgi:two-component system, sensor histidine kinase YesM
MKLRITQKISFSFFGVFIIILLTTFIINYVIIKKTIDDSIITNLSGTADLIAKIVKRNVNARESLVKKDLIISEQFIKNNISVDETDYFEYGAIDPITEEIIPVRMPAFYYKDILISESARVVDEIGMLTESIVSIFQYDEKYGFVSVASTLENQDGERNTGTYLPIDSPVYKLLMNDGTHLQREYFDNRWYFAAYKLVYQKDKIAGAIYVAIDQVDLNTLRNDMVDIVIGKTGYPYIIGNVGQVIIHPNLEGENIYHYPYIKDIVFKKNGRIEYYESVDGKDKKKIAFYRYLPEMDWILIAGTYMDEYYDPLDFVINLEIVIFIFAMFMTLLLDILVSRMITKPINQIIKKVKGISEGEADFDKKLEIISNDEIGELSEYFNNFIGKLKDYKNLEKREIELTLREIQIVALQNQINPHFLYNTLDTIRYMIALGDDRSVEMVQLLSDLFRVSIGKGERIVTLREEIEHVKLYVSIEKIRFPHLFTIEYALDKGCEDLYVLKFLLQPIVENSIKHGFSEIEENGIIRIEGRLIENNVLELRIVDNGKGMQEDLPDTACQDSTSVHKGIGLFNISERIRLHFGDNYRMTIGASGSSGTAVTVRLPALTKEDEEAMNFK